MVAVRLPLVGEGVVGFRRPGDRVLPLFYPLWHSGHPIARTARRLILGETIDGCLQEYLNIDADSVVRAPANVLDDAQGSDTGLCRAHGLVRPDAEEASTCSAGQTVLVQGTGGVSLLGLQLAKAAGRKGGRNLLLRAAKLETAA